MELMICLGHKYLFPDSPTTSFTYMQKDIKTFNIDNKNYSVESLSTEGKELLKIYLETEEDAIRAKVALVKAQHALASMGEFFRKLVVDIEPIDLEEFAKQEAAKALIANGSAPDGTKAPAKKIVSPARRKR